MSNQRTVQYVVGTTLDAKPITVTHVLSEDGAPETEVNNQTLPSSVPATPFAQRKTCSHAQKDARVRHKGQQAKKQK